MRWLRVVSTWAVLLVCVPAAMPQNRSRGAETEPEAPTRYFELTLVLRFPAAAGRMERVESLTTDIAVRKDRPGASSGRARVMSQVPVMMQKGPTYLDLGTKLDCNDVRLEGNALALAVVLETSSVNGTVMTEGKDGKKLEEPLISQRNLSLQTRLPLGKPVVIFDTKNMEPTHIRTLQEGEAVITAGDTRERTQAPAEMQVEMTARELP